MQECACVGWCWLCSERVLLRRRPGSSTAGFTTENPATGPVDPAGIWKAFVEDVDDVVARPYVVGRRFDVVDRAASRRFLL